MRLLVAEDDLVSSRVVTGLIDSWGYDWTAVTTGVEALKRLRADSPPDVALLDWLMPGLEGIEVCRQLKQQEPASPTYIILLTSKNSPVDVVEGLEAGADDYLRKPFNADELHARVKAGWRIVRLQSELRVMVNELKAALTSVRRLSGLLPICSYCKSVRDDKDYWHSVEAYVSKHSEARFSHGICPKCLDHIVMPGLPGSRQEA